MRTIAGSMRWIADLLYFLAGLAYSPVAIFNAVVLGKNRRGWRQRFGCVPRFEPGKRRIWVHAVSLGEVNATPKLVEALQERLGDCQIVISTTTDTGYARAVHFYGPDRVFRFPLDFSMVIARVLRRINPTMVVLVELEVWYNLVRMATRCGIPVAVVNGRLTERSARRFGALRVVVKSMFRDLAWVGAQDEDIARRFRGLGTAAKRISITSSLKWDSALVADRVEGMDALAAAVGIDGSGLLWVCGSTGPGEELIILEAYRKLCGSWRDRLGDMPEEACAPDRKRHPQLAIVPRKPERFDEVAKLIERAGFACVRRSDRPDGCEPPVGMVRAVILGDTMGELRKFYALSHVVFVGRTLVPLGGSDPMEVAALGKPIVVGPHTDNFESAVGAMRSADAIRCVADGDGLHEVVGAILAHALPDEGIGSRAREVVLRNQGATRRTVDHLVRLLESAGQSPRFAGDQAFVQRS